MAGLELGLQARAAGNETAAADPAVKALLERKLRRLGRFGVSVIGSNRTTPEEVTQQRGEAGLMQVWRWTMLVDIGSRRQSNGHHR